MSSIRNITVTDARLRQAVQSATRNTINNNGNVSSSGGEVNTGVSCTLLEAPVLRWYVGIDKVIIRVNNEEVTSNINYPFINKEFIISVMPEGDVIEGDDGAYIEPTDTTAQVLRYENKYLILGFKQADSTRTCDVGEILLQAGDNCINICPDFINITTNALFINGRKYEQ